MSIFANTSIYINGDVKNKQHLSKTIKENGGTIAFMVGKTVTHMITSNDDFQTQNSNIKKALSYNVNIVSEQWITDSISQGSVQDVSKYTFTVSSTTSSSSSPIPSNNNNNNNNITTNEPVTDKLDLSSYFKQPKVTATKLTKKEDAPTKKVEGVPTAELSSGFSKLSIASTPSVSVSSTPLPAKKGLETVKALTAPQIGKLYTFGSDEEPEFPSEYTIDVEKTLQCSLIQGESSNNKFYHLELHRTHIPGINRVFSRYGRTDGKVTSETRYYNDFNTAKKQYEKTLAEKTSDAKGYEEVALISCKMSSKPPPPSIHRSSQPVSTMNAQVKKLVENIFNEATKHLTTTCAVTITERGIETPLGVLSTTQVEKGETILEKIGEEIKKPTQNRSTLESLSSKFYTCIPYKLGRGTTVSQHVITNGSQVNDKMELLQLMKDLIKIGSDGVLSQSAMSMKYAALKNYIEVLSPTSLEYKNLLRTELKDIPANVQIDYIYTLEKTTENMAFLTSIKPSKLLFHGSRFANFVGILSRGMLLPKVIVATGGARSDFGFLGAGIYYSDQFDRSLQYAHPSLEDQSSRLMLVSEVAIGKFKTYTKIDSTLTKAPLGFDSTLGLAATTSTPSDFKENEFVIYKTEQQKQRYLIQFSIKGSTQQPVTTTSAFTPSTFSKPVVPTTHTFVGAPPKTFSNNNNNNVKPFSFDAPKSTTTGNYSLSTNISLPTGFINSAEEEKETNLRKLFATSRNDSKISDPFVNCQDVFTSPEFKGSCDENISPLIMPFEHVTLYKGENATQPKIVDSLGQFEKNWSDFSNKMFDGFNWSNVFVAGGSVLGCTLAKPIGFSQSDIDIFLYGLSEQQATDKLKEIFRFIKSKCPTAIIARTKYAVTFLNDNSFRNIQVVLRVYKSPAEVLLGFDIDCCSIGYDGKKVVAIPRARDAIVYGVNRVCMSRRSTTYETRLFKYAKRGFAIYVPKFDRSTIPSNIYSDINFKEAKGLHKLLLLEFGFITGNNSIVESKESDYSDVEMPWGQYWRTFKMASYLVYKDKSQFFANKTENQHRHIVVVGENETFNGKASWCRKCSSGESTTNEDGYVNGTIKWVTQDPGRQLLTGSFHPITDDQWYEFPSSSTAAKVNQIKQDILDNKSTINTDGFVFKPTSLKKSSNIFAHNPTPQNCYNFILNSNHLIAIAAAYGKDAALRSILSKPQNRTFINTPCEAGFYPVHYAIIGGNVECLRILIDHGAFAILKSHGQYRIPPRILATAFRRYDLLSALPYQRIRVNHRKMHNYSDFRPTLPPSYDDPNLATKSFCDIIKSGNMDVLRSVFARMPFGSTDPDMTEIGETILHTAVLSPRPREAFDIVNQKYPQLISRVNIFGQSVYDYALIALSSIHSFNPTTRSCIISPEERAQYQYIAEQSKSSTNGKVSFCPLPIKFYQQDQDKSVRASSSMNNIISGLSNVSLGSSSPPPQPFGQGGKFPAGTPSFSTHHAIPQVPVNQKPFSFGTTAVSPTTGGFSFGTPINPVPVPQTTFSFGTPPQPHFKMHATSIPPSPFAFANINTGTPINPVQGPHFSPTNPVYQFSSSPLGQTTSDLTLPGLNHEFKYKNNSQFLCSSVVAKCLTIIHTMKSSDTPLSTYEEDKVRELVQRCYMPVINSFESYLIHLNTKSLFEDLKVALKIQSQPSQDY